jgi:hypothetical protein
MPQEIRILQIADLLIEDAASADRIFGALEDYRKSIKPDQTPDYLVVCGNITKAGEPEHFEAAHEVLVKLRDALFPDPSRFPQNRVFLVPGARDLPKVVNGQRDSEKFSKFYQDFYSGVPSSFEQFDPAGATVRCLLDVTLIGLCYHMDVDPEPAIASMIEGLQKAKKRIIDWKYSVSMPVILVSSFPSMLSRDGSLRKKQFDEKWREKDEITLTSHLVGGPVTFIGREPFQATSHLTVGTGPVSPEDRWSGRINVITIYPRDWRMPSEREPQNGNRRQAEPERIAVTAHKWPDSITLSTPPYDLFGGHPVETNRKPEFVLSQIEADLLKVLNDHRGIAVTGLPGKGKSQVFEHCRTQRMRYACERLEEQSDREGLLDRLQKQVDGAQEKPIVVIHDNIPRREPSRAQSDSSEIIVDTLRKIAKLQWKGIYLFPYSVRRPTLPEGFGFCVLPPLDDKVMDAFKDLYSTRLPIKRSHLDRLINGYLGFAWLLFEEARRIIEFRWPGARPIEAGTSWALILEAMTSSYDLSQVTERFFAALRDIAGAGELRDYLLEQFAGRLAADGQTERLLDPIEFTVADVCQLPAERPGPAQQKDVEAAAARLSRARVLERVGDGSYRLLELIPFLVHILTNDDLTDDMSADQNPSPGSTATVFVSYAREDRETIEPVVKALQGEGFSVWWDKEMIGGTKWEEELERALNNSECVLLFLTQFSLRADSYTKNEAYYSQEKVIPVMLEENLRVPLSLQGTAYVSLIGWKGDKTAPEWKALIQAIQHKMQSLRTMAAGK